VKLEIKINGKTYEADVQILEDDEEPALSTLPAFLPPPVTFAPVTATAGSNFPDATPYGGEQKVLRSPVNGLVVRVSSEAGLPTQKGTLLMVLESMKMETNITTPGVGTVKSVLVEQGQSVKTGDILVAFE
jgi:methylmalonyl-CoA carboxyltransferase small subunit